MRDAGGYVDLQNSYEKGRPETDILVDRDRANDLGVSSRDVAETVRAAIGGVPPRAGKGR